VSEFKPLELVVAILSQVFVLATLMGLVVRRHLPTCRALSLFLLVVFVTDTAMLVDALLWRTETLYSRLFWVSKETLLNGLRIAILLELVSRVFGRFPGARATARILLFVVLGLTVASVAAVSGGLSFAKDSLFHSLARELQPRIVTGTTWLFAGIAALVLFYRLPIESMSKAILLGFVPYLVFKYLVLEFWTANNWPAQGWMASLDAWLWVLLLGYWARAAWQPFREIMLPRRPVPAVSGSAG
jgi:hypothetical protein